MSTNDDLPADPDPRDEGCEAWKPVSGPFEWAESRQVTPTAWRDNDGQHKGIAIRDGAPHRSGEWIASDTFTPDLTRMV